MDKVIEIDKDEKEWWGDKIREVRSEVIDSAESYIEKELRSQNFPKSSIRSNASKIINLVRDGAWERYLRDEQKFYNQALSSLIEERDIPREILKEVLDNNLLNSEIENLSERALFEKISSVVGDYSGRIMPYLYQISKSTTQSRRSRAGDGFEKLIESMLETLEYSYEDQSSLGQQFFEENDLTKRIDAILPSGDAYHAQRSKCGILSMKTTLRERWQQVVEELNRTNIPHVFLLTLDEEISDNKAETMARYNITLTVPAEIKNNDLEEQGNVIDFEELFAEEIPHILNYWEGK